MQARPSHASPTCSPMHSHEPVLSIHRPLAGPPQMGEPGHTSGVFCNLSSSAVSFVTLLLISTSCLEYGAMHTAFSAVDIPGLVLQASMCCSNLFLCSSKSVCSLLFACIKTLALGPVRATPDLFSISSLSSSNFLSILAFSSPEMSVCW